MAAEIVCRGIGWSPDFDAEVDLVPKPDAKRFSYFNISRN
jgi:hypothetical protein